VYKIVGSEKQNTEDFFVVFTQLLTKQSGEDFFALSTHLFGKEVLYG